ncbi:hypothetical protein, partial [Vibrio gazogenes]
MAIKKLILTTVLVSSMSVYGAERFVVQDIQVDGLQRVTLGAALLKMPIRVGDTVGSQDIADLIKALYSSGNFENIRVFR